MTNFSHNKSLLGFNWQQKKFDENLAKTIYQRFNLSETLSKILAAQLISLDQIENFLTPRIKTELPDPYTLGDMETAVSHLICAIKQQKKITIFADYDVDGATSSALLCRFFRELKITA